MSIGASLADPVDLGYRQLYAYAMRHFFNMPKEQCKRNLLAKRTIAADKRVLRESADLANRLGFESAEIAALKSISRHPLVTDGLGKVEYPLT